MVGYTCDCCRANFVNYDSSGIEEMDGSARDLTMIVTSSEPSGLHRYNLLTVSRKRLQRPTRRNNDVAF